MSTKVKNCYSCGTVYGNKWVGGLIGQNGGEIINSYWNAELFAESTTNFGTKIKKENLMDINTYLPEWNITNINNRSNKNSNYIWNIIDKKTTPILSNVNMGWPMSNKQII